MPQPRNPAPHPVAAAQEEALAALAAGLGGVPPPVPNSDAVRAQRLLAGAIMSSVLEPDCDCGTCRRLRKVARLTHQATEEDLDDA